MTAMASLVQNFTVLGVVGISGALVVIYCISQAIHNIYFHPLSGFPGPKLNAASNIQHLRTLVSGHSIFINKKLHEKYGPVVRIAPNLLSFASASSWKDIYGHVAGRQQFLKASTYDSEYPTNIITARDPHEHGQMRRLLSHGFSQKALMEQEDTVQHYVDLLIKQINIHATGKEGEEIVKWYNFATFDVIGDLAFGDPFGSLDNAKPHFWVTLILDSIESMPWVHVFRRFPFMQKVKSYLIPKEAIVGRKTHLDYSRNKVIKRMESTKPRKDFFSRILAHKEAQGISIDELSSQAHVLILAGSETTASFLSAVTYYLCHTPRAYAALTKEIRDTFKNYEDIQGHSTESLTYLKATIDEGLRVYPPLPVGMPRVSPGDTVDGVFIPKGAEVATWAWAATHSTENFHRPYEFMPERWIDPNCTDKKEASQPFMLGSRVCLGRNLAYMEMRLILSKILWTYDMELMDKNLDWIESSRCYSLWKKPKLVVKFTKRAGIYVPAIDD